MTKEIRIDGIIGGGDDEISAAKVRAMLPENGTDPIVVKIHSEGGVVFEGFAIYDLLKNYAGPKKAVIESCAFSIASFIPMACDEIEITPNGYMMMHNPYSAAEGDDETLAKSADLLRQLKENMVNVYASRTGKSTAEIAEILKQETYLNAQQTVAAGFANRVTSEPVRGRILAKMNNVPHGVVLALFGAESSGNHEPPTRRKSMSDSQPVAATLQEIKAAYPQAKADFIVRCLEKSLPMASVASAAVEEMMQENQELSAKCKAMEEELAALKGKAMEGGEDEELPDVEGDEEEIVAPVARGVKPVKTVAKTPAPSARAQWDEIVESYVAKGLSKVQAARNANKTHGHIRAAMLSEVNG